MKVILMSVSSLILGLMSCGAEPLKVGDAAPSFTATASDGNTVKSADLYGKKPVVLYFYPKDDTPGCTKQACAIRDDYADWQRLDAAVFGVNFDSVDSHRQFAEKHRLPFLLLADTDKQIAKAFGVATDHSPVPPRATFVVGLDGKIAYVNPKVNPVTHSAEIRAVLAKLPSKK
jgi:peroxiredoxin Q/BCP